MVTTATNPTELFYNAETGETVIRELTPEEIAAHPQPVEPVAGPE